MPRVACAVYNCTNNSCKLEPYRKEICTTHNRKKGKFCIAIITITMYVKLEHHVL